MTEHPDRQRLQPTVEGRARLLAAIEAAGQPHVVDAGTLGEYAEVVAARGQVQAEATFPEVAAHLESGCAGCADDLRELLSMAAEPPTPQPPDDSGIYAVDLPDVRAAEAEAARRRRLRRIRDWLLVAAAVAILLMGLSLVGLAYVANRQPGPRLGLTPAAGRAAPNGMTCPASHPVKGNRPSMIYHLPGGEFYDATSPEDCFASPADAEAAGSRRRQR
jgi:hypothetical protein